MRNKSIFYVVILALLFSFMSMPMMAKADNEKLENKRIPTHPPRRAPAMPVADVSYIKEAGTLSVTYNVFASAMDIYVYREGMLVTCAQAFDVKPGDITVLPLEYVGEEAYQLEIVMNGATAMIENL